MREGRLFRIASLGELIAGLSVFILGYAFFSLAGVFMPHDAGLMRIFHKAPVIVALWMMLVSAVIRQILYYGEQKDKKLFSLLHAGIILAAAGIIVSSFVRFEARLVLTEGQRAAGEDGVYVPGSVYSARWASPPKAAIEMVQVSPRFRKGGMSLWNAGAKFIYQNLLTGRSSDKTADMIFPAYADGFFFRVRDFGYSPRYRISNEAGVIFDEAYSVMRIFPPGEEDSFRLTTMPNTFYLRYFPDALAIKNIGGADINKAGPVYRLRVARNLDIITNQYISMQEKVKIESVFLSIEDTRRWVEIGMFKDYGLYLLIPGITVTVISLLIAIRRRTG